MTINLLHPNIHIQHYNSFFREILMHFCFSGKRQGKAFHWRLTHKLWVLFLCFRARRKFWKLEGKLEAKALPFQTHSQVLWKFSFMFAYSEKNFLLFFCRNVLHTCAERSTKFSCILHASSFSSYRVRRWNQIISNTFFYAAFHFLSLRHLKCETLKQISPHDSCFCN